MAIPEAEQGLVYNGDVQTGVWEETGYTLTGNTGKDAGGYTAVATLKPGYVWNDGTFENKTIKWNIDKKTITVITYTASKSYDSDPLTAGGIIRGLVSGETVTFEVTGTQVNVGQSTNTYELVFDGTANVNNYEVSPNLGTLTVKKAKLTKPTEDPLPSPIYNGEERTYKPSGFISSKMSITGDKRENAGSQNVIVSIRDKLNYEWEDGSQDDVIFTFTINPRSLQNLSKIDDVTYSGKKQFPILVVEDIFNLVEDTDYVLTWEYNGGSYTGDDAFTNAGEYTLNIEGINNFTGTYTVIYKILPKSLTVTADNKYTKYPNLAPEFTVTYDGFVNGETEAVLSGILAFDCDYNCTYYQSFFDIFPKGLTSENYDIKFVKGVLEVVKAVIIPKAISNLTYSGWPQNGVSEGTGYSLTGNTGTDAGTYIATAELEPGSIWSDETFGNKKITWTIGKKDLTAKADDANTEFPNIFQNFTISFDGFVNGETEEVLGGLPAFDCDYNGTVYKETFPITPSGYTSDNYNITFLNGTLTVRKAPVAVPAAVPNLVYSGKSQAGVLQGTGYTVSGSVGKNAGNYTATVELIPGYTWPDSTVSDKNVNWVIAKKPLTVTADSKNMTFLGNVPEFTATYNGFVNGESKDVLTGTLKLNCSYDGTVYRKTVPIIPEGLTSDNYEIEFVSGTLTVGRISVITPEAADPVYSGKIQTGVFGGTGYTLSENTGKDAGRYAATAKLDSGYEWDDGSDADREINWIIAKKRLIVRADDREVTFFDPIPEFTETYDGFVNGETEDVLTGSLEFDCAYDGTVYKKTFPITPKGLTSDNYDIIFTDGTLTVNRIPVAAPEAISDLVYTGKPQAGVFWGTGYTVSGNTGKNVGKYMAVVRLAQGYEWDDGSDTNKEISWAIFKKALTVTADSKNMVFLGAVPEFTATYSGFVGGETEKALTGNLRFNCGYDGKSYQKTFLITPEGLVSDNYEIEFVSGTLTVGRISVTVPDAAADLVYNGDFQTGISEGTGYTVSGGCKKDAGSHVSTLKLLPGHVWSDSSDSDKKISWVIAKKSLKVTADSKIMNFLGDVPVFTVTYSGFEGEENESVLGGTLKFQCGYSGKYYQETFSITPSGLTSDNYALTFKDGTLTVLRALADVPRPLTELVYDGTEQTGVEGNGYDVVRGSTYAVNAGKYTVSVSPKDGYMWPDGTLDMKTAEWSIARKEVKVVTDSAEKVYDGKALSASGRIEGLVEGDGVIFRVTGERTVTGSSPNTYVLTFNGTGNVGNYKVTENLGTLKITAAHLNRPAAGKTLIMYDGTEKTYLPAGFVGNAMKIRGNIGTEPGFYGVTVSIKDMLNYSWTDGTQSEMKFGFRIVPRVLPEAEAIAPAVYTGENQVPVLTLKYGDTILREGRDYSAVWNSEDFVGAGTYTADVKGIGVYSDFYTVEYVIEKIRLNRPSADPSSFLYDGTEKTYSPAGFDGTVMDISGNKRTERGTQTVSVSIKDKANYEWNDGTSEDAEFVFTVGRLSIPEFGIDGTVYSGNRQIPEFVIRDGSRVLKEGTDYETVWDSTDFVCAGVYSASVTGIGVYSGTRTVPYVIERIKLDKPSEDSTVFVCDGTEKVYCPGGFDCGLMCMEGNTAVSAGTHNVSVSVKDSVNYEWADGTQDVLNFRFDVAAVPEPPLVEKYESIPSVTGAIAAAAVLALCYVCFFRRP